MYPKNAYMAEKCILFFVAYLNYKFDFSTFRILIKIFVFIQKNIMVAGRLNKIFFIN